MRATLIAFGALLFLAYPLVMLFAVVGKLDQSQQKPPTAAIILTPRSANQWLEGDAAQRSRGELRSATIRRYGN
jgi:hypothetical protein